LPAGPLRPRPLRVRGDRPGGGRGGLPQDGARRGATERGGSLILREPEVLVGRSRAPSGRTSLSLRRLGNAGRSQENDSLTGWNLFDTHGRLAFATLGRTLVTGLRGVGATIGGGTVHVRQILETKGTDVATVPTSANLTEVASSLTDHSIGA